MKTTFTASSFAIIADVQNRVMLCHRRDYDLWNLPGGAIEHSESPDQAIIREIREELNVTAEMKRLLGVYTKTDKNELVFMFECVIEKDPALSDEVDKIEYFTLEDIPKNTSPKQVQRIRDYLEQKRNNNTIPIVKTQTGKSSIQMIKNGEL